MRALQALASFVKRCLWGRCLVGRRRRQESLGTWRLAIGTRWLYDENHQRVKDIRVDSSGGTRSTWYMRPDNQGGLGFERETAANGASSNRHYISAGGSAFAVIVTARS